MASNDPNNGLARRTQPPDPQGRLFDCDEEDDWRDHWWGMPSFVMGDARPMYSITVNFFTFEDVKLFGRSLGVKVTPKTDSVWFPPEELSRPKEWEFVDEP